MTAWFEEECGSAKPEELQVIAPNTFMERKDLIQKTVNEELIWFSTSRKIKFDEYYLLKSIEEINTDKAIDDYTMQLIEEGLL